MTPAEYIEQLDALDGRDAELDHAKADDIVLDLIHQVAPDVYDAYMRLMGRATFWAFA